MLTGVPKSVSAATRQVVLRHPNSMSCFVHRKRVIRLEADPASGDPSEMGGAPTLGGMGVLKSEDEVDYVYDELGEARFLLCGIWQQTGIVERDNALLPANTQETQIECILKPEHPDYFVVDTGDLVLQALGFGVVIAYTIEDVTGSINIPPFTRKYAMSPRDDLHALEPFMD